MYRAFFKRVIDFSVALVALLLILPILLVVAIVLYFANKEAGVFFIQERPGKNGKLFKILKFKTMTEARDADGNLLPDEARPLWKPMHKQPVFADAPAYVNGVSEALFKRGLCLPSGPCVTEDDVRYIVQVIKDSIL